MLQIIIFVLTLYQTNAYIESTFFDFEEHESGWVTVSQMRSHTPALIPTLTSVQRADLWLSNNGPDGLDFHAALRKADALTTQQEREIEADILRSGPALLGTGKTDLLSRVLRAFAARRPDLGYVQGMNYIAAEFLVLGFSEPEAFNGLVFFVEELGQGYYSNEFRGFNRDVRKIEKILSTLDFELILELDKLQVFDPNIPVLASLLYDSLLTFFARPLAPAVLLRVWDAIFLHGHKAVIATAVVLVKNLKFCFALEEDSPVANFSCFKAGLSELRREHVDKLIDDISHIIPLV